MDYRKATLRTPAADGTAIAYHRHLGAERPAAPATEHPQRPAVLLTNGIGTTENFWRFLVARLADDFRVVHWDYRGHGESENAHGGGYTIDTHVDDLARITERVVAEGDGRTPPVHIGFSMGVAVVLELYRRRPELVRGLVLIAGSSESPGTGTLLFRIPGLRAAFRASLRALTPAVPALAPVVQRFIQSPLLYATGRLTGVLRPRAPRADIDYFMRELARMDPLAYWETLKGLMEVDASDVLPTLDVPVLIVSPTRDLLIPASQLERMRAAIPHAEYLRVEDAGHATLLEAGTEVASEVYTFLHRLTSSPAGVVH